MRTTYWVARIWVWQRIVALECLFKGHNWNTRLIVKDHNGLLPWRICTRCWRLPDEV